MTKITLQIHGKVQGVFYRQSALEVAKLLGLAGWIKNNPDGTVETEALGPDRDVEQFVQWCRKGPPRAQVSRVDIISQEDLTQDTLYGIDILAVFSIVS